MYKVVEPFIRNRRISYEKAHTNNTGVHVWFQFKPNAFDKVTFKILTSLHSICNRVVHVYCNSILSNNRYVFFFLSPNTTVWNVNSLVRNSGV